MTIQDRDRMEWAYSPVTQEFLQLLKDTKQETMEAWSLQAFPTEHSNSQALGSVRMLGQLIGHVESFLESVPTGGNV